MLLDTPKVNHTENWLEQHSTGVHEIMHAMGFSGSRFAYFWDHVTGQPRTPRASPTDTYPSGRPSVADQSDAGAAGNTMSYYGATIRKPAITTLSSFTERGGTVWKITTPTATDKARSHFACSTLNGVELEDEGGPGTEGSHWQQRIFMNEVMCGMGIDSLNPVMSDITLGFFHDTGWYVPDYAYAGRLAWGQNAGCAFATAKCLTPGSTPSIVAGGSAYWCKDSAVKGCNYQNTGYGQCNVATFTSNLPSRFQYWTGDAAKGGSESTTDRCPRVAFRRRSFSDCRKPSNTPSVNYYGQSFGSDSRCFSADLIVNGYVQTSNVNQAGCYRYKCEACTLSVCINPDPN